MFLQRLQSRLESKNKLGSFDFEKFLFPIPPPIKITVSPHPSDSGGDGSNSKSSSDDEFVSLDSSTSGLCSSSGKFFDLIKFLVLNLISRN